MADIFDIVDIVFAAVEKANTGLPVYKHRAETGVASEHIVINSTGLMVKAHVNKAPVVSVNLFTRMYPNGMLDVRKVKQFAEKIRRSLQTIEPPKGLYFDSQIAFEADLGEEVARGYDCYTFRLEIITE